MPDPATITRLQQAATFARADKRLEAAPFARQVLANDPDNLAALLWLGYTSPSQLESEEVIARAYELDPNHPSVLKAVGWYNQFFMDVPTKSEVPGPASTGGKSENAPSKQDRIMHTPVGNPVKDSSNFFMSQDGGMVIGSTIVMVLSLGTFVNYTFLKAINLTPFGLPRIFYGLVGLGLALIAAGFLFYAIRDVLTPPLKAHGFISNRREIKRPVKTGGATTNDVFYELDFLDDENAGNIKRRVLLHLTREQYEASAQTNRAFVVYSKRLGYVKLYQPLRSVYY